MKEGKDHSFTKSEMKVLLLVCERQSAAMISELLGLKLSYVYTMQKHMNKKYGFKKIQYVALLAIDKGWILLDREAKVKSKKVG